MNLATKRLVEELSIAHCSRCDRLKHFSEFTPQPRQRNGLNSVCRTCAAEKSRIQRAKSPETRQKWRAKRSEIEREQARLRYQKSPSKGRKYSADWRERNPEKVLEYRKIWSARPETKEAFRKRAAERRSTPAGTLKNRIGVSLLRVLRGGKGGRRTEALIGYPISELKQHLERQFVNGMTWANMGQWHIDHIVPLASFDISGPDDPELRRAWALPNLRPLWAADNLAKRDQRVTLL